MIPHQMLDALSRQTGAALAFNGDGLCRLRFDGRFIVDLEVTDDEDAIYLYARLGTLPAGEQGRELMARMMRAGRAATRFSAWTVRRSWPLPAWRRPKPGKGRSSPRWKIFWMSWPTGPM